MPVALPRVVLDTNVVVSSFWGGVPARVVEAWLQGRYVLLISPRVLAEYQMTLERLLPDSPGVLRFLHAVYLRAIATNPSQRVHAVRQDPADNRFLECAVAGKASYLVSGDQHLLRLRQFRGIRILSPKEFLGQL